MIPSLKAVCNHLYLRVSPDLCPGSIGGYCGSTPHDPRCLRVSRLQAPQGHSPVYALVGSLLFGGQFQFSVEEATHSQKKFTQVRRLASAGLRAAQGTSGSRAPPQSQKHRAKNRGNNRRSGGAPAQSQAQQGARGQGASNKRPQAGRR